MCVFRLTALTVILVYALGNHGTRSIKIEFQAFDATEPLLRFQQPFLVQSNNSDVHVETLADILLTVGDTPIDNVTGPCRSVMQHMAEQGGDFTRCLLGHARPFRMCEKCIVKFTVFTNIYEDLLNDKRCASALLLADRMHLMTTVYDTFTSIWNDAHCPKCYDNVQENATTGDVTFNYTADTLLFQEMESNVSQCFNDSNRIDDDGVNAVCKECKDVYRKMNDKFSALQSSIDGQICMDLVDMMNYTRLQWSSKFKCTRPRPDASVVIGITVIVVIVTVLLYLTSKFIAKIRMPQIFKAKRMMTRSGRYGAISCEEVETSLPRFAATSLSQSTSVERRRGDSFRDVDGNGYPRPQPQRS